MSEYISAHIEYKDKNDSQKIEKYKGDYEGYVNWFNSIVNNKDNKLIGGSERWLSNNTIAI